MADQLTDKTPQEVERVLQQRALILAHRPSPEMQEETLRLLTFPLGEEKYGVEITLVREVKPLAGQAWCPVPCTPDFIVGAVNIRGRLYSLMDIAIYLGLRPRATSETAHVLLAATGDWHDGGEMDLAILADGRPGVDTVPLTRIQPPSAVVSGRAQEYVRGIVDDRLIVLDLERLLADPDIVVAENV